MGFRTGAYAKVWEVTPLSDTKTKLRISISRKNKQTNTYEQDFSGYVVCFGTAVANAAMKLGEGARIKLGDCDVSTRYDAEKKITYTNYKLFSFEAEEGGVPKPIDMGEPEDFEEIADDNQLPF